MCGRQNNDNFTLFIFRFIYIGIVVFIYSCMYYAVTAKLKSKLVNFLLVCLSVACAIMAIERIAVLLLAV